MELTPSSSLSIRPTRPACRCRAPLDLTIVAAIAIECIPGRAASERSQPCGRCFYPSTSSISIRRTIRPGNIVVRHGHVSRPFAIADSTPSTASWRVTRNNGPAFFVTNLARTEVEREQGGDGRDEIGRVSDQEAA